MSICKAIKWSLGTLSANETISGCMTALDDAIAKVDSLCSDKVATVPTPAQSEHNAGRNKEEDTESWARFKRLHDQKWKRGDIKT